MTKQEEILDGVAEFNYYYPDGKPTIRVKWEELSDEQKKPYLDVARLQVFKLHSPPFYHTPYRSVFYL